MNRIIVSLVFCLFAVCSFAAVSDSELRGYIENGDKRSLFNAIKSGVDLNHKIGKQQQTLLHIAVIHSKEKIVYDLLKHGADANAKDAAGKTPLHYAATSSSGTIVTDLVTKGADLSIKDAAGKYPLDLAKEAGNQARARDLSVAGMMVNQQGGNAPTDMGAEQQQMMQSIMGSLLQKSQQNKPKKSAGINRNELAAKLVGKWVNTKTNHIITFHKNGRYEGTLSPHLSKKRINWSAGPNSTIRFSEVKVSGFGGLAKNVKVQIKDDGITLAKSNFAQGEYVRATDELIAQARANIQKRREYVAKSLARPKPEKQSTGGAAAEFIRTRHCDNCTIKVSSSILTKGEVFDWSIARNSDFSTTPNAIWQNINFNWSDFQGSKFTGTRLWKVRFYHADLRNTNFSGANLQDVNFAYANLEGANFRNATIDRAMFTGANLKNADFTGAKIKDTDFTFANQAGWKFKATTDKSVKIKTTDQEKLLAGLWVQKVNITQTNYLHVFKNGMIITSNSRNWTSGNETFFTTKGKKLLRRTSKSNSSFSNVDTRTFDVRKDRLVIRTKTQEQVYTRANKADREKYKSGIYKRALTDMTVHKKIAYLETFFNNGFSFDEARNYREFHNFSKLVVAGDADYEDRRMTVYLMKLLVKHGMDYKRHVDNRTLVAESAIRGQLETLEYLLSIDKRAHLIEGALRERDKIKDPQAIAILEREAKIRKSP